MAELPDTVDFTLHDARTHVTLSITGGKRGNNYGWQCLRCGAHAENFATGEDAKAAAIRHNGGAYNEA